MPKEACPKKLNPNRYSNIEKGQTLRTRIPPLKGKNLLKAYFISQKRKSTEKTFFYRKSREDK